MVLVERILDVVQEHGVVAQRRHGDADLTQIEQVLQDGHFSEYQTVRDVLGQHEGHDQVIDGTSFATMRSEVERVHLTVTSEVVQSLDVGVHVVDVVDVGRIFVGRPVLWQRCVLVECVSLRLGLVID